MDPEKIKAALEAIKNGDADAALALLEEMIAGAAGAGDAAPEAEADALADAPDAVEEEDEQALTMVAASKELVVLQKQAATREAALAKLTATVKALEDSRAESEQVERVALVAELVVIGAETPATAWAGDAAKRQPVARLSAEPLKDLKARVEMLKAASPRRSDPRPPVVDGLDITKLSQREIEAAQKRGFTPEQYAARKAAALRSAN
jgi:hypothetical protein